VLRDQPVKAAHPIGEEKCRSVVFAAGLGGSVDDERVGVPFHGGAFVGWEKRFGLGLVEAVDCGVHNDVWTVGVLGGPVDGVDRHAVESVDGAGEIYMGVWLGSGVDYGPERVLFA